MIILFPTSRHFVVLVYVIQALSDALLGALFGDCYFFPISPYLFLDSCCMNSFDYLLVFFGEVVQTDNSESGRNKPPTGGYAQINDADHVQFPVRAETCKYKIMGINWKVQIFHICSGNDK